MPRPLGALGARLALTFVAVALTALAVLTALTLLGATSEVDALVQRQRERDADDVAAALALAYERAGGWDDANLAAAATIASADDATLRVSDAVGATVTVPVADMNELMQRMHGRAPDAIERGDEIVRSVVVGGSTVGTVSLRFPSAADDAQQQVRDALVRNVLVSAGIAGFVALGVGLFVARRVTRPIDALTRATRALEAGDRAARAGAAEAPGELGELSAAFDRMADALAREDALRRSLVADVAHELRTPVTVMQASCEAFRDGVVEPTPANLASLHDESLRLGRLVEDLETLAHADAAVLTLTRERVDLRRVAQDATSLLAPQFDAARLALTVDAPEPVVVDGDPARLHQIVTNLLTNALKYTPPGGSVTVGVRRDGALAHVEVSDTGRGIPEDEIPHLFERFWRGRAAATTAGSGVGLAVAAELARAHRGRIEVDSRVGHGTRFTVLIPLS